MEGGVQDRMEAGRFLFTYKQGHFRPLYKYFKRNLQNIFFPFRASFHVLPPLTG